MGKQLPLAVRLAQAVPFQYARVKRRHSIYNSL